MCLEVMRSRGSQASHPSQHEGCFQAWGTDSIFEVPGPSTFVNYLPEASNSEQQAFLLHTSFNYQSHDLRRFSRIPKKVLQIGTYKNDGSGSQCYTWDSSQPKLPSNLASMLPTTWMLLGDLVSRLSEGPYDCGFCWLVMGGLYGILLGLQLFIQVSSAASN